MKIKREVGLGAGWGGGGGERLHPRLTSFAQAVELTKMKTNTNGTGKSTTVSTVVQTHEPSPRESWRKNLPDTKPPIIDVPVYASTVAVATPPRRIAEKVPRRARTSTSMMVQKNCAPTPSIAQNSTRGSGGRNTCP